MNDCDLLIAFEFIINYFTKMSGIFVGNIIEILAKLI